MLTATDIDLDYCWKAVSGYSENRLFFITKQGYIGMGPSSLQEGDTVCILFGGYNPFILRPVRDDSDSFRLVGDAYVDGVMEVSVLPSSSFILFLKLEILKGCRENISRSFGEKVDSSRRREGSTFAKNKPFPSLSTALLKPSTTDSYSYPPSIQIHHSHALASQSGTIHNVSVHTVVYHRSSDHRELVAGRRTHLKPKIRTQAPQSTPTQTTIGPSHTHQSPSHSSVSISPRPPHINPVPPHRPSAPQRSRIHHRQRPRHRHCPRPPHCTSPTLSVAKQDRRHAAIL